MPAKISLPKKALLSSLLLAAMTGCAKPSDNDGNTPNKNAATRNNVTRNNNPDSKITFDVNGTAQFDKQTRVNLLQFMLDANNALAVTEDPIQEQAIMEKAEMAVNAELKIWTDNVHRAYILKNPNISKAELETQNIKVNIYCAQQYRLLSKEVDDLMSKKVTIVPGSNKRLQLPSFENLPKRKLSLPGRSIPSETLADRILQTRLPNPRTFTRS